MKKISLSTLACCFFAARFFAQNGFALDVEGFDSHVELIWPSQNGAASYRLFRSPDGQDFSLLKTVSNRETIDFTGFLGAAPTVFWYQVEAVGPLNQTLFTSEKKSAAVFERSDSVLLDMVQRATLRYFTDGAHPVSGMARERSSSGDIVTTGGTGFGIMAILTGAKRGWLTRQNARDRILKIAAFLAIADRFHGAFPHWMNGQTGDALAFSPLDDGADLVETAFLMQGILAARQFFDDQNDPLEVALKDLLNQLWQDVEWDFFRKTPSGPVLFWHWSPTNGWAMNFPIRGYNEAMIVYLLAVASPTHSVPTTLWKTGWQQAGYGNGNTWFGQKIWVGPALGGPMFFAHYSFLGFDPRSKKDAFCNYFLQNQHHALVNQAWCAQNPKGWAGYSADSWGLTASDVPNGYFASAPGNSTDLGTIAPTAALASMPYSEAASMAALKHFYRKKGAEIWRHTGFADAFNETQNWVAADQLAIDQGPIVGMIENARSGFLWQLFMSSPEILPALLAVGFVPDSISTAAETPFSDSFQNAVSMRVFPNPADETVFLEWKKDAARPSFFAADGRAVFPKMVFGKEENGWFSALFELENLPSGVYFLKSGEGSGARFLKN